MMKVEKMGAWSEVIMSPSTAPSVSCTSSLPGADRQVIRSVYDGTLIRVPVPGAVVVIRDRTQKLCWRRVNGVNGNPTTSYISYFND